MWLAECVTTHVPCSLAEKVRKLERAHFTPRRLLNLYTKGTHTYIKLLSNTKALDPPPVYMTLSHCWGQNQPLMLEKNSLSLLKGVIPLKDLPRTYADAVVITLRMGCQYLWIDSLCIVQDSAEDWEAAVQEMGNIYRFSSCNIAALDACDAMEGCFSTRIPHVVSHCAAKVGGRIYHAKFRGWGNATSERILAPRTIGFGASALTWECLQGQGNEINRGFTRDAIDDFKQALHQNQGFEQDLVINNQDEAPYPMSATDYHFRSPLTGHIWHRILERYTASQLTFRADRWAAISGVARAIQSLTGCSLLAGMWRENMLCDLAWAVESCGSMIDNSFPSWSWVSVDATLLNWHPNEKDEVVYSIMSLPEIPEDHLKAGVRRPVMPITLRGPLRRMTVYKRDPMDQPELESVPMTAFGKFLISARYDRDRSYHSEEKPSRTICALLQYCRCRYDDLLSPDARFRKDHYFGMLVTPASSQEGCWKRIGSFNDSIHEGDKGKLTPEWFGPVEDIVVI
ncbi:hypothetical protein LTR10_023998 [Elasticomyces elasticus]|uniref:Heterokaryon incompatibility domain-containing protein n=1 Tax=Exophiala sideris TaxID=1016849 RepID=A0ABR0IVX2_9EURO|nr:hypothetical protein LTR10_023998 [Elasticomyces elasticus]KAK5020966.1 hypothetical protein LTS07_011323 [Exophiala sideris]KAK5028109.1 hypothetical protein LTR13_009338 [Exophiala sideris]KAK5048458.1 hypothetical protein LTR69_011348 [Exophiala sideris]KAK5176058.1 hypothetical protein LTR44_011385 [Eurotiomycetes sp. CCFEE 6388]